MSTIWAQAHFSHLIDDASLHRLQPVSSIGQGSRINNRVGVLQEAFAHFASDIDIYDALSAFVHWSLLCETWRVNPTLPPPPKGFGSISHVFSSALEAVQGRPNKMGLAGRSNIIVAIVDGLGAEQLQQRAGHAPFLASSLGPKSITYCAYPATTSANIGSFATGLMPGEHGLIGHQVWDKHHNERLNLLVGWNERTDPLIWQPHQTIAEKGVGAGVAVNVIAAEEYRSTPYSVATMRGSNFVSADSISERIDAAISVANSKGNSISYLYFPELDKYGHKYGWTSPGWAALLEEVGAGLQRLSSLLGPKTGLIVSSDHGMVETQKDRQLVLDDYLDFGLEFFGGDTRSSYIYLRDESAAQELLGGLETLGHALKGYLAKDLISAGWFGNVGKEAEARMPDVILQARSNFTLYHSQFSKQRAFDMIAHHGSISPAEMRIPLLRFGF